MTNIHSHASTIQRIGLLAKIYWKYRRFGLAILTLFGGTFFLIFTRVTLLMDYLFFPVLWKIDVKAPIFILGHPRSGTTFFQKRIYESNQAAMFTTWEMLFPALTVRKILHPIILGLRFLGVDVLQGREKGHQIRLDEVEEEEALFLHRLDSEILHILCPWLIIDDEAADDGFRLGWNDFDDSDRSVDLMKEFLKRQILYTGKTQIVVKLNPSIFRLHTLLQKFPDAKIVYIIRKPQKSIRSFLSFQHRFVQNFLSWEEWKKYFQEKYRWSLALYQYFESVKELIPPDQLYIIHFSELIRELVVVLKNFFDYAEIEPGEDYWDKLSERLAQHQRKHRNLSLSAFGLDQEDIEDNLDFLWDEYDL